MYERIVGPAVIERAESEGLVRSSHSPSGFELEAAHPLFVEIARVRMGVHRRMRLSGRLATEWAAADAAEGRTPSVQDVLRDARLRLDSELDTPPDRLAAAASLALSFTDLELAERLSRAALVASEHPEALFALGMALTGQAQRSRGPECARAVCAVRSGRRPRRRDGSWRHALLAAPPARSGDRLRRIGRGVRRRRDRRSRGCARCALSSRCSSATLPAACASSPRSRPSPTPSARSCRPGRRPRRSRCRVAVTMRRMLRRSGYEGRGLVPANLRFGVAEMHLTAVRIDGRARNAVEHHAALRR